MRKRIKNNHRVIDIWFIDIDQVLHRGSEKTPEKGKYLKTIDQYPFRCFISLSYYHITLYLERIDQWITNISKKHVFLHIFHNSQPSFAKTARRALYFDRFQKFFQILAQNKISHQTKLSWGMYENLHFYSLPLLVCIVHMLCYFWLFRYHVIIEIIKEKQEQD